MMMYVLRHMPRRGTHALRVRHILAMVMLYVVMVMVLSIGGDV